MMGLESSGNESSRVTNAVRAYHSAAGLIAASLLARRHSALHGTVLTKAILCLPSSVLQYASSQLWWPSAHRRLSAAVRRGISLVLISHPYTLPVVETRARPAAYRVCR